MVVLVLNSGMPVVSKHDAMVEIWWGGTVSIMADIWGGKQ